jgi:hypothetical protein
VPACLGPTMPTVTLNTYIGYWPDTVDHPGGSWSPPSVVLVLRRRVRHSPNSAGVLPVVDEPCPTRADVLRGTLTCQLVLGSAVGDVLCRVGSVPDLYPPASLVPALTGPTIPGPSLMEAGLDATNTALRS